MRFTPSYKGICRWVCLVSVIATMLTGCGSGKTVVPEPSAKPVVSDFSEKPGQKEQYVHSHPVGTTVRYDLNGDGVGENITVTTQEYEAGKLTVGNVSAEIWTASPTGYFTIMNVNEARDTLLVGISDYGPSDDPLTVL